MNQPQKKQKLYACRIFSNSEDLPEDNENRHFPDYLFSYYSLNEHKEMLGKEVRVEIEVASWGLEPSYNFVSNVFQYYCDINSIKSLYERAKVILKSPAEADTFLPLEPYPPQGYDKNYFINLRTTVIMLEDVLKEKLWTEKGWFFSFKIS